MDRKLVAIVLGGTNPHVELINELKNRGYYTVLIDYYDNPPAKKVADKHVKESTLDYEKVLEISKSENANLVISACIDQANATACYVAEKLNLPRPYSFKTAIDVTNKKFMKKIFKENGIWTSDYYTLTNINEFQNNKLPYPVVTKPVDCNSSKGVYRCENDQEAKKYLQEALQMSRTHEAIIERFIYGEEIQVDCYVEDGQVQVLMTRQKRKLTNCKGQVLQSFGSIVPAQLSDVVNEKIKIIAERITKAFNIVQTPFFYQAIVNGDDIDVLEFAPRIGGGLSYCLIKEVTGFDILKATVNSFLGIKNGLEFQKKEEMYSTNILYMEPGIYMETKVEPSLYRDDTIVAYYPMKNPGTTIDSVMSSGNRVGAFLIRGKTLEELNSKFKKALENIQVLDNHGKDKLKRSLYE